MKGDKAIIETRKAGKAPKVVYVHADGYSAVLTEKPMEVFPDLVIFPEERLSNLDLRFLVGLQVRVDCLNLDRLKAVMKACVDAKAKRVIGHHYRWVTNRFGKTNAVVEQIIDSDGVLNWENTEW